MGARSAAKSITIISLKMIIFALVVILLYYAGGAAYKFGNAIFKETPVDTPEYARTVRVIIPDNPDVMDVAEAVQSSGAVNDKYLFFVQAKLSNYAKKFTGGSYEVSTGMTPTEIMIVLAGVDDEEGDKSK